MLQKSLNPNSRNYDFTDFQIGDKVMQTKNNYMIKWKKVKRVFGEPPEGQGIFNGDIGYVTGINTEDNTVSVLFDEDKIVEFESQDLDELELAYAVTIHKSQGSEFKVVIIPVFHGTAASHEQKSNLYRGDKSERASGPCGVQESAQLYDQKYQNLRAAHIAEI